MVRIAFIGAGNMAEQHARAFAALPGTELTGVWSRTRANAEAFAARHGIDVHDSIDELRAATRADLAIVAVKELGTLDVARQAGRHDWTLLFEKPAGHTVALAEQVRDAAEAGGKPAYLGLNRRFYAASLQAREHLETDLGPRFIHVLDQQSFGGARAAGHAEEVVRNFMYANSIHLIDYLVQFGRGDVISVTPDAPWRGEETFAQGATVRFASGDIGRYDALWNAPGPWACIVATPAIRFEMRPLEALARQAAGTRRLEPVEIGDLDQRFKAGFYRQAEEMLKAVRGEPNGMPTLEEGLVTMRLIHAIYAEAAEGRA